MNYYTKPRKLILSKIINNGTKRAIRERLEILLQEEESNFQRWNETVRNRLNPTLQKQIEREFNKRIQALKIVIYYLTPYMDRVYEVPTFVVRKTKKQL